MLGAMNAHRILVMGCGGIGGLLTGYLTEVGADVTAVTTNQRIADAVETHGFRLRGDGDERTVRGRISLGVPTHTPDKLYDLVLLATQPPSVEQAARTALPLLAEDGNMVVFQNGLCEARIARIAGDHRVIGGIIAWGASMPEPGVYDRTSAGGFTLGRIHSPPDRPVSQLASLLEVIGPVAVSQNLVGARWSKLALNSVISSLGTIAGERLGPLVRSRRVRRLGLEIITEAVATSAREGVTLEKVAGTLDLDWVALSDADRRKRGSASLTAKHALLLAVGLRYRRLRSSMLSAIERGRTPAIDFLNGEIVDRARKHGINAPVNQMIVDTVHAIARGELTSDRQRIYEIYERTSHLRGAKADETTA